MSKSDNDERKSITVETVGIYIIATFLFLPMTSYITFIILTNFLSSPILGAVIINVTIYMIFVLLVLNCERMIKYVLILVISIYPIRYVYEKYNEREEKIARNSFLEKKGFIFSATKDKESDSDYSYVLPNGKIRTLSIDLKKNDTMCIVADNEKNKPYLLLEKCNKQQYAYCMGGVPANKWSKVQFLKYKQIWNRQPYSQKIISAVVGRRAEYTFFESVKNDSLIWGFEYENSLKSGDSVLIRFDREYPYVCSVYKKHPSAVEYDYYNTVDGRDQAPPDSFANK